MKRTKFGTFWKNLISVVCFKHTVNVLFGTFRDRIFQFFGKCWAKQNIPNIVFCMFANIHSIMKFVVKVEEGTDIGYGYKFILSSLDRNRGTKVKGFQPRESLPSFLSHSGACFDFFHLLSGIS